MLFLKWRIDFEYILWNPKIYANNILIKKNLEWQLLIEVKEMKDRKEEGEKEGGAVEEVRKGHLIITILASGICFLSHEARYTITKGGFQFIKVNMGPRGCSFCLKILVSFRRSFSNFSSERCLGVTCAI